MKKKRVISLILKIAKMCSSALLGGCGEKESEGKESINKKDQKMELTFWNVFTGSDGDVLRSIVDNYNKTNTDNIQINMDIMPNDTLQQKLPAAIATDTAPDFVLFGVENIAPYVANDSLEDISDFWEVSGVEKDNFLENVVDLCHVDGKNVWCTNAVQCILFVLE